MSNINTLDIVKMVLDEATEKYKSEWKLNIDNYETLKKFCSYVDIFYNEFKFTSVSAEFDNERNLIVTITGCEDGVGIKNIKHGFYKLIDVTNSVNFSVSNDTKLNITFVFSELWDKVVE